MGTMLSRESSNIGNESSKNEFTQTAPDDDRISSCDFCSKVVSVFSTPYDELCRIDLGNFSDAITLDCPHSESLRKIKFKFLTDGVEHWCENGTLEILSPLFSNAVSLQKICSCDPAGLTTFRYSTAGSCDLADLANELSSNGKTRIIDNRWIDVNLIRSWHDRCQSEHGKDCDNYVVEGLGSYQPDWLIDTVRGCLIPYTPGDAPRQYSTLSYVWGQTPSFQALKSNIGQLQEVGVLLSGPIARQIPKTIRDAIQITRRLGETFIWVDSLCIVQDDAVTRGKTLRQMHLIYLSSVVTIIAEHGQNARQGIRGIRGLSKRRLHQQTRFEIANDTGKVLIFKTDKDRHTSRVLKNPHDYHMRMWTYQEYLFSKRRLIFGSGPVAWMCNKAKWLEDEHSHPGGAQPEKPFRNPMNTIMRSRVPSLLDLGYIVSLFSGRAITHPTDVLFSFSGIQSMLHEQKFPDGLLYGLPEFYFDIALTWIPNANGVVRRRLPIDSTEHVLLDKLPSWSWIGWKGAVDFIPDNEFESRGPHWAEAFGYTAPVTEWFALESPKSEYRRAISSRWHEFRTSNSSSLPEGWSREKFSLSSWKAKASRTGAQIQLPPKSLRKYIYYHVSEPDYFFWYPVPIPPRTEARELLQRQYLYCKTSRAFLNQRPGRSRHTALWDDNGLGIGTMCYGTNIEPKQEPQKLELVAVVKGWFARTMMSYEAMKWARNNNDLKWWKDQESQKLDCYFVLSIEWENDVAYRKAVGWVIAEEWDKNAEPIELILG
ncbi:HET-domain-containing protein [Xylaria cubensis]|nr:HET-domain-containing protein [Xylaria cubensis]